MRGLLYHYNRPLRNGSARKKVVRRRDCVRNLDTLLVCARRHRQMTMKCAYSSVSFSVAYCGHTVRNSTRASRGLIDVKLREQITCNPRFKREIKLVRLKLNCYSRYFAISNEPACNNTGRAEAFSTGGNYYNLSS